MFSQANVILLMALLLVAGCSKAEMAETPTPLPIPKSVSAERLTVKLFVDQSRVKDLGDTLIFNVHNGSDDHLVELTFEVEEYAEVVYKESNAPLPRPVSTQVESATTISKQYRKAVSIAPKSSANVELGNTGVQLMTQEDNPYMSDGPIIAESQPQRTGFFAGVQIVDAKGLSEEEYPLYARLAPATPKDSQTP